MDKITCTIEHITFQNPENGYSVLQASMRSSSARLLPEGRKKGYREYQTLVGRFHEVTVGAVLIVVGDSLVRGGFRYRKGDRVMQIRNNYDKYVFNGDIGTVASVDTEDRSLTLHFEGRAVTYEDADLDELMLAYAIHNQVVQKRNTRLKERLRDR